MNPEDVKNINTSALAYVGDAVYEVFVRDSLIISGDTHTDKLHRDAVKYVGAYGQAKAMRTLKGKLDEEEAALTRRARNHKISSKPKNVDPMTYKEATSFEALIGYLHLMGRRDRLDEILNRAKKIIEGQYGEE